MLQTLFVHEISQAVRHGHPQLVEPLPAPAGGHLCRRLGPEVLRRQVDLEKDLGVATFLESSHELRPTFLLSQKDMGPKHKEFSRDHNRIST